MPVHQYEASLYATPPSGGVRFVFALYPRVSFALLTPHRGYYMPPRHAARLLNSPCRFGRQPRPIKIGRANITTELFAEMLTY